jgi:hypothetical protein
MQAGASQGVEVQVLDISHDDSNDADPAVFHFAIGGWNSAPPKKQGPSSSSSAISRDGLPSPPKSASKKRKESPLRDISNASTGRRDGDEVVDLSASPRKSAKREIPASQPEPDVVDITDQHRPSQGQGGSKSKGNMNSVVSLSLKGSSPGKGGKKKGKGSQMKVAHIATFFKRS